MSFRASRGGSFIGPLYGHTVTFIVDSRRTNLALARSLLSNLGRNRIPCAVLDVDALYVSNSDYVFAPLSEEEAGIVEVLVPEPGSALEADVANLSGFGPAKALIIDSLNSLYHLLSTGGRSSRSMNLAFVVALLSRVARTEKRAVFFTMYQREKAMHFGRRRSISDLSDLTVSVGLRDNALALRCERSSLWPDRDRLFLSLEVD